MPLPIRIITYILPARYLMPCLQTLFLAGNVRSVLLPNIGSMAIIAAVLIGLTALRTKRRLD